MQMTTTEQIGYSKLEDLPSLRDGWVRLVHRCIYKNNVKNINYEKNIKHLK